MSQEPQGTGFGRVGIVGMGLMGGSLARSLKRLPGPPEIRGISASEADLDAALKAGALDACFVEAEAFLSGLELVVYCTPLQATLDLLPLHAPHFAEGTLITDVVSLKGPLMEGAKALGIHSSLVGSHPLAGGEGTGFSSSRPDLFRGAKVFLVAGEASPAAVDRIRGFWEALGANAVDIQAAAHDTLMTWISHLPQLTANALALSLEEAGILRDALGPGGKDMTRLAGSGPEMWEDLLRYAPDSLSEGLGRVEEGLARIRVLIEEGRIHEVARIMTDTRRWFEGGAWN